MTAPWIKAAGVDNGRQRTTRYPLIDQDPHASRVIRYMRPSDFATWAAMTLGTPAAFYGWEMIDASGPARSLHARMRPFVWTGLFLGFTGGFLVAYQRSSLRFWGWAENAREEARDLAELSQLAREGKPLYGVSSQPAWVQAAAHRNSQYSQLKFSLFPMLNLVNHPYHGTDPAKYGVQNAEPTVLRNAEGLRPGEMLQKKQPKQEPSDP
ncbi:NADH-ubiquinone oxidoreductase complex I, 21 kDa subunit-domain-containing protein [Mycena alexandri]|uniref:NADH-ubiquinone oxidoreductase complex I, 21 kDa subunit-domain-containing protein n=1 Tax=Mycena alexandri TaxID=1745969 RepID=A0AAD6SXS2_9AGAR|nr:NADH-ubiquinone oxidoreductase complex I, 21 kDa subunit-domain-containing protein [Mycena alexandri]